MADNPESAEARQAVEELTAEPLPVIGMGVEKVVYGSRHWVIHRRRRFYESASYYMVWRLTPQWLKRAGNRLPALGVPGGQLVVNRREGFIQTRFERLFQWRFPAARGLLAVLPESWWIRWSFAREAAEHTLDGLVSMHLVLERLQGTGLFPERVGFAPVQVELEDHTESMTVSEAFRRVDRSMRSLLHQLDAESRGHEISRWLDRVAVLQERLWEFGIFSADTNLLANHGIIGDRVVLMDGGKLTSDPAGIDRYLSENLERLIAVNRGNLAILAPHHPEALDYFEARLRALFTPENVRAHWDGKRQGGGSGGPPTDSGEGGES